MNQLCGKGSEQSCDIRNPPFSAEKRTKDA
jgi:hypothetical protein